ncbi:hypothetical protein Btru_039816 [Bulinus truncatus]|nr:hypothetical protein Btru_039816 [Bulinus truncatus]
MLTKCQTEILTNLRTVINLLDIVFSESMSSKLSIATALFIFLSTCLTVTKGEDITCGKGEYYVVTNNSCLPCPENSFMDRELHRFRSCFKCADVRDLDHVVQPKNCSREEDTSIASCEPGFFPGKNGIDFQCLRCPLDGCALRLLECCDDGQTNTPATETNPTTDSSENAKISFDTSDNNTRSWLAECAGDACNGYDTTIGGRAGGNGSSSDGIEDDDRNAIILGVTLSTAAALLIIGFTVLVCFIKKRSRKYAKPNTMAKNDNIENAAKLGESHPQPNMAIKRKKDIVYVQKRHYLDGAIHRDCATSKAHVLSVLVSRPQRPRLTSAASTAHVLSVLVSRPQCPRLTSAVSASHVRSVHGSRPQCPRLTFLVSSAHVLSVLVSRPQCPRLTSAVSTAHVLSVLVSRPQCPRLTSAVFTTLSRSVLVSRPLHPLLTFVVSTAPVLFANDLRSLCTRIALVVHEDSARCARG